MAHNRLMTQPIKNRQPWVPTTEETIPKLVQPYRQYRNSKTQATGTVPPTCRSEAGPVDEVPAGYESDDSWGWHAPADEEASQTPDLEEELLPFLTFHTWAHVGNRGRGRGCHHGQHRPYTRQIPARQWDGQPYGRCTRSPKSAQSQGLS